MKNKLLLLFVLITTFGYAQTFDWETAYHGADTPNGSGWTNNRAIQEFTTPSYNGVIFTTPNATPINISNVGQGSTGLSVLNAAYETSVEATFVNPLNIQSIKVFTRPNSSNENWTFKAKDAGGNVTNTLTAVVTNTANVITLNFTNVYVLEITKTDGTTSTFCVDDIVFTPYVACNVSIPDANFKAYLVGNTAINTNGDTEIQCSEATAFTGAIDVYGLGISDLTGVEAFTALTELQCSSNQLTSLDVSANTALTELQCNHNQLTTLDVSGNTALTNLRCENNQLTSLNLPVTTNALIDLRCRNNQLTSLDVSANTALTILACNFNQLTSLDVSTNIALESLHFYDNPVTSIDVSTNTALTELQCGSNQLTSIDVSANTNLEGLYFSDTQLTSIDVSTNTALKWVYCENSQLTSLDLSAQPNLEELTCYNNQLTSLNLANGNNGSILSYVDATNNTALTCINVDAATVATPPAAWYKDATATYSDNCAALSVDDFNLAKNEIKLYPNPATTVLNIEMTQSIKQVTIYSMLGKEVLKTQNNTVDVSGLSNGFFLIKVEGENGNISTQRFIKK